MITKNSVEGVKVGKKKTFWDFFEEAKKVDRLHYVYEIAKERANNLNDRLSKAEEKLTKKRLYVVERLMGKEVKIYYGAVYNDIQTETTERHITVLQGRILYIGKELVYVKTEEKEPECLDLDDIKKIELIS